MVTLINVTCISDIRKCSPSSFYQLISIYLVIPWVLFLRTLQLSTMTTCVSFKIDVALGYNTVYTSLIFAEI